MTAITLAGGMVLTMAGEAGSGLLDEADVILEDARIAEVRPARTAHHGEVIDCRGRLVLPGLVNAHAHALEGLFRGCGGELSLLPWIRRTHALMDRLDASGARVAGRLAAAEMLLSGTTAYLDPEIPTDDRFDGLVGGLLEVGIRPAVTLLIEDRGGYHQWSDRASPALTQRELSLVDHWAGDASGVRVFAGPSVLSAVTPALGLAIAALHAARGTGIAFHFGEVPEDLEDAQDRGWATIVDLAADAGLLVPGAVLTHGVRLDGHDIARLADRDVTLVHCPSSNAKLASGIAPVTDMLAAGLNVALGSDGAVCNDGYDMFAEMRLATLLQKAHTLDPAAMAPIDALRMATVAGARALGIDAGRLAPGALADVIVVERRRIGSWPSPNPIDSLVYATGAANVVDVFVGGEPRVRDGRLMTADISTLLDEAAQVSRQAIDDAGLTDAVAPRG
jgi:cytosine/adenosine deaminase-related metal-dependent hydrolase